MNEIIYLENDEEITSVIDRLRKAKNNRLALVIPRGGNLAQSIVNLKLLKRSAGEMGKEISLVSNDRISRNLASQIGLTVYSKAAEAEKALPLKKDIVPIEDPKGDFKVNSYYGKADEAAPSEEELEEDADVDPEEDIEEDEDMDEDMDEAEATEETKPTKSKAEDNKDDEPDKIKKEDIDKAYKEPEAEDEEETRDKKPSFAEAMEGRQDTNKSQNTRHESGSIDAEKIAASAGGGAGAPASEGMRGRKPMSRNKKIALGIIAGCVILLLAVAYVFLPYASIKVMAKTEDLSLKEKIVIDPTVTVINQDNLTIPGTVVDLEKEVAKTYPTTGKKDEGVKATGKITISNSYCDTTNPIQIIITAGSKFVSGDKVFLSQADVTVPCSVYLGMFAGVPKYTAGTIDVNVVAENTGTAYNIGPSDFIISSLAASKQSLITGHSAAAMTGGTTKTVNVVADADLKAAEADLTKTITDAGKTELIAKATDQKLENIESKISSEILSKEASKNLNDEADNFDYRINMKLSVLAYSKDDIKTVLTTSAEKNLTSDKMLIGQDKFDASVEYVGDAKVVAGVTGAGAVEMNGTLAGKTGQKISDKEIKDKIKGKKYAEARTIIEQYSNADGSVIQIWPSSVARIPLLTSRIKITFDYAQ